MMSPTRRSSPDLEEHLITLLLDWLDVSSLQLLDEAIMHGAGRGAKLDELRLQWLKCLSTNLLALELDEVKIDHDLIRWLIDRGVGTSRIQQTEYSRCTITDATFVGIFILALKNIDLSGCCSITDEAIRSIVNGCPLLSDISLRDCVLISDTTLFIIAENCHEMRAVDVSNCFQIGVAGISALVHGCPLLQSLAFRGNGNITNSCLATIGLTCEKLLFIDFGQSYSENLSSIDCRLSDRITDVGVCALAQGCPLLQSLVGANCDRICDESIRVIGLSCQGLLTLDLQECYNLSDICLSAIAETCTSLQSITFSGQKMFTADGLIAIGLGCRELLTIKIRACYRVSDTGYSGFFQGQGTSLLQSICIYARFTDLSLIAIGLACPALINIELKVIGYDRKITDNGVSAITQGCPLLQSINLQEFDEITDASIIAIGFGCPRLLTLQVKDCNRITDIGMCALAQGCPLLQVLNFGRRTLDPFSKRNNQELYYDLSIKRNRFHITDIGIRAIAQGCPSIRSIVVVKRAVSVIDHLIPLGIGCRELLTVDLDECSNVTDAGVRAMVQNCSLLQSISLQKCGGITDATLSTIGLGCCRLQKIHISNCIQITDIGVCSLARGCPLLRSITLDGCRLTDVSIIAIALGCLDLLTLSILSYCAISDIGIRSLARGCSLLQSIALGGFLAITDAGLVAIREGCLWLATITLDNCPDFPYNVLRKLKRGHKNLQDVRINHVLRLDV
jgi:F-box and leucine-rich repeat protein 2/20